MSGFPKKVTFSDKQSGTPLSDPNKQLSAQEVNDLKKAVNENALFYGVEADLATLQTKHPNPPKGAFAYIGDGKGYRSMGNGWKPDVAADMEIKFQDLENMVTAIGAGESGKSYATLAEAQAVDPKPQDGTVFQVEEEANAGYHKFDSTQAGGTKFLKGFVSDVFKNSPQKSNNSEKLREGYLYEDGTYSSSTSWLTTESIKLDSNQTYTLSGIGGYPTTGQRVVFYDAAGNVLSFIKGLGSTNSEPVTFTTPAGTLEAAFGIASGSGVASDVANSPYQKTVMLNEGSEPFPYVDYGKGVSEKWIIPTTYKKVYLSVSGNDTYTGQTSDYAVRTLNKAKELCDENGVIEVLEGDFIDEPFDLNRLGNRIIKAKEGGRVRFIYGSRITSASATSGKTRVFETAHAGSITNTLFLWQHDMADVNTEIIEAERHPLHRGRQYRLGSTRLHPAASIDEIENTTDKLMWFLDAGVLYFSKSEGSNLSVNPIVIPTQSFIEGSSENIQLKNFEILYQPLKLTGCTGIAENIFVGFTNLAGAIVYDDVIGFEFKKVEVAANYGDGFNGHSSTPNFSDSKRTNVTFYDCYSHDNGDDGTSNHEYCEETIYGGLYEYNGNGVTPASGAHTSCYTVTTQKNGVHPWTHDQAGTGFSAQGSAQDGNIGTNIWCFNCISIGDRKAFQGLDNSSKFINCISKDAIELNYGLGENLNSLSLP